MKDDLLKFNKDEYGSDHQAHILEIYKLYVEMADRVSSRRQVIHSFHHELWRSIGSTIAHSSSVIAWRECIECIKRWRWRAAAAALTLSNAQNGKAWTKDLTQNISRLPSQGGEGTIYQEL